MNRGCGCGCMFFFFKQKTAYEMRISDWSSDVCSSDLAAVHAALAEPARIGRGPTDSEPQRQRRDERDQQGEREKQPMALRQSRKPHLAALRTVIRAETVRLAPGWRSEEHTSELQSLMRISYAVFCLKNKNRKTI